MNFEIKVSVYRGDIEESCHFGAAAVVVSNGDLLHSVGNPELITYPRSALNFIQAVALVETAGVRRSGTFQLPTKLPHSVIRHGANRISQLAAKALAS